MPIFNFKEQPKKTDLPEWMLTIPPGQLLTTFPYDSEYGRLVNDGMMKAERLFAFDLLAELERQNVPGAIVEFGVFDGTWLVCLADHREKLNANREVWGFDSFEGLPATTEHDLDCWKEAITPPTSKRFPGGSKLPNARG